MNYLLCQVRLIGRSILFLCSVLFATNTFAQWHWGHYGLENVQQQRAGNLQRTQSFCPPNLDFESGDFTNWVAETGNVKDIAPSTNLVTMTGTGVTTGRHEIIASTSSSLDIYGEFPTVCPNGSGYSVKLGNDNVGAQAERLTYTFTVPLGLNEFSITYWYAVVFDNPAHQTHQQPRFQSKVYADGVPVTCASFDYTATSGLPGFSVSKKKKDVLYKEWAPVTINLSGNAGKTIILEFTTVDCTESGHFGYAYLDVNSCQSGNIYNSGMNFCDRIGAVSASAPPGFKTYNWYSGTVVTPAAYLGTGQSVQLTPPPANGSFLAVTLEPYPGFGCYDTIYALVKLNAMPKVSFTVDTPSLCLVGNQFNFTNTSNIDSGTLYYRWTFGDGGKSFATNPSYSYNAGGQYTVKLVVTSSTNCIDSVQKIIKVIANPNVSIQVNDNEQCVAGNQFVFTNKTTITPPVPLTYTWRLGDNSAEQHSTNVTYTYATPGFYTIKLFADTQVGCQDSATINIQVRDTPSVHINAVTPLVFCVGSSSQLQATATPAGSILKYDWYENSVLAQSNSNNTPFSTIKSANVWVKVTNLYGCTNNSDTLVTDAKPLPIGSVLTNGPITICDGSATPLTANGNGTYQWLLNNNPIAGATNAIYQAKEEGTYTVQLKSAYNCTQMATGSVLINVIRKPAANFGFDKYCYGQSTKFTDSSYTAKSGTVYWKWDFGDNTTSSLKEPVHTYGPNTYPVKFSVFPSLCPHLSDSKIKTIAMELPNNVRYPHANAAKFVNLPLKARNIGDAYQWIPAAGISNPASATPFFNYNKEQEYRIKIHTPAGCNNVDTQLVRIFEQRDILVPKAFTPNNDGNNDELYPFLVGVKELVTFRIYNRWGQLMYTSYDTKRGWNGKYNGVDQPSETYTWVAEGIAHDGQRIKASGTTILLR